MNLVAALGVEYQFQRRVGMSGTNQRIMKRIASSLLIVTACLLAGCSSTRETETSEMRRGVKQQMSVLRNQLQSSGASQAQLRDFDRAVAAVDRQMRQLERQLQAMEKSDSR